MNNLDYKIDLPAYLSTCYIFLGIITLYIMYYYPNHKFFSYDVYPSIWMAYFCSIGLVLLVPVDLAITIKGRDYPNYYDKHVNLLISMYLALYWPTLILNNIILVFQEMYKASGYFKIIDKIKGIFIELCWQILIVIVAGSIIFGILVGKHIIKANINAILVSTIVITNTIWLTYLMILLGYGFVIFPIRMWENSSYSKQLERIQHKASSLYEDMRDTSSEISICVANILKTNDYLIKSNVFVEEMKELMVLIPEGFHAKKAGEVAIDKKENKITVESLAKLKSDLYEKKQNYMITKIKVEELEKLVWKLEDIIETIVNNKNEINWTIEPKYKINKFIECYYYTKINHILYKVLSILSFATSLFSFLGVFGSIKGIPVETSVYFLVLHDDNATGTGIVIFTLLTLGYTFFVAMWALYEMKITGIMELVKNNGSWPISMSFHSRMVARLVPPLVYFYLSWIHENQNIGGNFEKNTKGELIYTAFSKFYQIQVVPILGNSFTTFFPIFMLCVSFLTITNFLNRFLIFLKLEKYQFGQTLISESALIDGKKRLNDKKKIIFKQQSRKIILNQITTQKNIYNYLNTNDDDINL